MPCVRNLPAVPPAGSRVLHQLGRRGIAVGQPPKAQGACRKGSLGKSRSDSSQRILPTRFRPVATILEQALQEVHRGQLDPTVATAMASLAGTLVRVITSEELEQRLRAVEGKNS